MCVYVFVFALFSNNVINAMEDMDIMDTLTRDDMVNELLEDPSILPPEYNDTQKLVRMHLNTQSSSG